MINIKDAVYKDTNNKNSSRLQQHIVSWEML